MCMWLLDNFLPSPWPMIIRHLLGVLCVCIVLVGIAFVISIPYAVCRIATETANPAAMVQAFSGLMAVPATLFCQKHRAKVGPFFKKIFRRTGTRRFRFPTRRHKPRRQNSGERT